MLGTPSLSYFKNVLHQHLHSEDCFPYIVYTLLSWTKVSNFWSARGLIILIQEQHVVVKLLWNSLTGQFQKKGRGVGSLEYLS